MPSLSKNICAVSSVKVGVRAYTPASLPSLSATIGEAYIINNASPTYTVTIDPDGTDKIQGISSGTYAVPASSVVWVWDSKIALGGWFVIIKSTP